LSSQRLRQHLASLGAILARIRAEARSPYSVGDDSLPACSASLRTSQRAAQQRAKEYKPRYLARYRRWIDRSRSSRRSSPPYRRLISSRSGLMMCKPAAMGDDSFTRYILHLALPSRLISLHSYKRHLVCMFRRFSHGAGFCLLIMVLRSTRCLRLEYAYAQHFRL